MNVIITGASRGLGKAMAEQFAAQGHNLYLGARNKTTLNETVMELRARFPTITIEAKTNDLGNRNGVEEFGQWILDSKVFVDVLINNAGSFIPGSVHDEPEG